MVSKSRFSLIFLYTGSSELVNRTETSKLKDAPRVLPAGQYGERLFLCAWRRGVHDLDILYTFVLDAKVCTC